MADNDQPSRLEAATIKTEAASSIVSRFANNPADETIPTESGNIPTLKGVIGDIQAQGAAAAQDVYDQAQEAIDQALSANSIAKLSGATFTGPVVLAGNPTQNLQAATKQYVDNAASLAKMQAVALCF